MHVALWVLAGSCVIRNGRIWMCLDVLRRILGRICRVHTVFENAWVNPVQSDGGGGQGKRESWKGCIEGENECVKGLGLGLG